MRIVIFEMDAPRAIGARQEEDRMKVAVIGTGHVGLVTGAREGDAVGRLRLAMRTPVLFDGRNVWSADQARRAGFLYHGIGRHAQSGAASGAAPARPSSGQHPSRDSES